MNQVIRPAINDVFTVCPACSLQLSYFLPSKCERQSDGRLLHQFLCNDCGHEWTEGCTDQSHIESPKIIFDDLRALLREEPCWHERGSRLMPALKNYSDGPAKGHELSRNWNYRDFLYLRVNGVLNIYVRTVIKRHNFAEFSVSCIENVERRWGLPRRFGNQIIPWWGNHYELDKERGNEFRKQALDCVQERNFLSVVELRLRDFKTNITALMPPCSDDTDMERLWSVARRMSF